MSNTSKRRIKLPAPPPETPELDRLAAERHRIIALHEFLEWLGSDHADPPHPQNKGRLEVCEYLPDRNYPVATGLRAEQLVYAFLGVDANKIEAERRALLDWPRGLNEKAKT